MRSPIGQAVSVRVYCQPPSVNGPSPRMQPPQAADTATLTPPSDRIASNKQEHAVRGLSIHGLLSVWHPNSVDRESGQ
jgi:hypothetical protein